MLQCHFLLDKIKNFNSYVKREPLELSFLYISSATLLPLNDGGYIGLGSSPFFCIPDTLIFDIHNIFNYFYILP